MCKKCKSRLTEWPQLSGSIWRHHRETNREWTYNWPAQQESWSCCTIADGWGPSMRDCDWKWHRCSFCIWLTCCSGTPAGLSQEQREEVQSVLTLWPSLWNMMAGLTRVLKGWQQEVPWVAARFEAPVGQRPAPWKSILSGHLGQSPQPGHHAHWSAWNFPCASERPTRGHGWTG